MGNNYHIPPISSEMRELHALEARLAVGDVTLDELRDMEAQFIRIADKTGDVGRQFFIRLDQKRRILIDRQVAQLDQKGDLVSKIQKLSLLRFSLPPETTEKEIEALFLEAALLGEEEKKTQEAALRTLQFEEKYPIVYELKTNALTPNVASCLAEVAKKIAEGKLDFFFELNQTQQRHIYAHAKGG